VSVGENHVWCGKLLSLVRQLQKKELKCSRLLEKMKQIRSCVRQVATRAHLGIVDRRNAQLGSHDMVVYLFVRSCRWLPHRVAERHGQGIKRTY